MRFHLTLALASALGSMAARAVPVAELATEENCRQLLAIPEKRAQPKKGVSLDSSSALDGDFFYWASQKLRLEDSVFREKLDNLEGVSTSVIWGATPDARKTEWELRAVYAALTGPIGVSDREGGYLVFNIKNKEWQNTLNQDGTSKNTPLQDIPQKHWTHLWAVKGYAKQSRTELLERAKVLRARLEKQRRGALNLALAIDPQLIDQGSIREAQKHLEVPEPRYAKLRSTGGETSSDVLVKDLEGLSGFEISANYTQVWEMQRFVNQHILDFYAACLKAKKAGYRKQSATSSNPQSH